MHKVISFHSFRRGTGKSTLIANLAVLQAGLGYRVGVIDNALSSPGLHRLFGLREESIDHTLNQVLRGECGVQQAVYTISLPFGEAFRGRVFLLPASAHPGTIAQSMARPHNVEALHLAIQSMTSEIGLDCVLLDTEAGIQESTLQTMAISRTVIVVLRLDQEDYQGTSVSVELAHRLAVPRLLLVVNQADPDIDPSEVKRSVEETYTCDVGAVLPAVGSLIAGEGADLFALRMPQHPLVESLRLIAARALL